MANLSDEDVKRIAEAAAEAAIKKTLDNMYREVGRTIMSKALWALGVVAVLASMWFTGGHIK